MTSSPWRYFTMEELTCHCGCGVMEMDSVFMAKLSLLRILVDFPMPVSSGYRCPAHNLAVSSTGLDGPHTTGCAVDVLINRARATILIQFALNQGFMGVGPRQHGDDDNRIVHLDICDRPFQVLWTYP